MKILIGKVLRPQGINGELKITDLTDGINAVRDITKVYIDDEEYKVTEKDGNTIVTVSGAFIKNLAVGRHKISVVSSTGTAEKNFDVSDKPKTGDGSMALWTGLLILSSLGCLASGTL